MLWKSLPLAMLVLLAGCCYPVRQQADCAVCDMAAQPLDFEPAGVAGESPKYPPSPSEQEPKEQASRSAKATAAPDQQFDTMVKLAGAESQKPAEPTLPPPKPVDKPDKNLVQQMEIPAAIPGATAPPIRLPEDPKQRGPAISKLFPPLPDVGPDPEPGPGPDGRPFGLADLQRLALANSPIIRQAAADVEARRGQALQAGLYPNPNLGFEGDAMNQAATAGILGGFVEQLIKTGGKLKLAQAAATMDVRNAQLALRRAQADLAADVRAAYFNVLVAQENVKITRALASFTERAFLIQVKKLQAGESGVHEPMQLRVLAVQARAALVQARNHYVATWKLLAVAVGLPAMPATQVTGRVDMPIPVYNYDQALARVLNVHTDVLSAQNTVQKARYNLRFAQVTPVPDVDVRVMVQRDNTTPPFLLCTSLQVGVPLPIWDKNQGNIIKAQGELLHASENAHQARNDLTGKLADAFDRYKSNRLLVEYYRDMILPDQVRAYRGVFTAYLQQPRVGAEVSFGDVVIAQQTLATSVATYVSVLGNLWDAVSDVSRLLQTNDLFQVGLETECVAPVPDLEHLPPLPCCHPCNPLPDPALKGADGTWPEATLRKEEPILPQKSDK